MICQKKKKDIQAKAKKKGKKDIKRKMMILLFVTTPLRHHERLRAFLLCVDCVLNMLGRAFMLPEWLSHFANMFLFFLPISFRLI